MTLRFWSGLLCLIVATPLARVTHGHLALQKGVRLQLVGRYKFADQMEFELGLE